MFFKSVQNEFYFILISIVLPFVCIFQYHKRDCKYILTNCEHENCEFKVQRLLLRSHMDRCKFRQTLCQYCNEIIIFKNLKVSQYIFILISSFLTSFKPSSDLRFVRSSLIFGTYSDKWERNKFAAYSFIAYN